MRKLSLALFITVLCLFVQCKGQEKYNNIEKNTTNTKKDTVMQTFEKFDIERFNRNKTSADDFEYDVNDSIKIVQFGNQQMGYQEKIIDKNSLIQQVKAFYPNGYLKIKGQIFPNNFQKGMWYYYDENGYLTKTVNHDAPYKFTWEDVQEYAQRNQIDLKNKFTNIYRESSKIMEDSTYWEIYWVSGSGTNRIWKKVKLDGNRGKLLSKEEGPFQEIE